MMRDLATVTLSVFFLSSCVLLMDRPRSTDLVKDAVSAIRIAQRECDDEHKIPGKWEATLHRGEWNVDFWPTDYSRTHDAALLQIHIRASDGHPGECRLWVTAD
jgi:hypothetical protein